MKLAVFDTHGYDRDALVAANRQYGHDLTFLEPRLTRDTASLAAGFTAVCSFVNDRVDAEALGTLQAGGTRLIALRSAGYNHVDLEEAGRLGLVVVRVPEYSPHAVAEHTVALILSLNRKIHRAYNRVREANFSLEGLVGFDLCGKVCGVVGTGRIGAVVARILHGFGCQLLGFDLKPNDALTRELGVRYTDVGTIYREADIITLHIPLTPTGHHLIDAAAFAQMKSGVMLINTGRGALVDSRALIDALKRGQVGAAGLDVYEEEEGIFFRNLSDQPEHWPSTAARIAKRGLKRVTPTTPLMSLSPCTVLSERTIATQRRPIRTRAADVRNRLRGDWSADACSVWTRG